MCRACRKREPEEGRKRCRECMDRIAALRAPRERRPLRTAEARLGNPDVADGWCSECQAHGFHRDGCPATPRVGAEEERKSCA
jgi:hypothetical protein